MVIVNYIIHVASLNVECWYHAETEAEQSSFRLIVHFVVEIQRFVCDRATPPIIEKLRSKGVAMHAYGVSVYYA